MKAPAVVPEEADGVPAPIVERADGFYWEGAGGVEVGPFASRELAEADRDAADGEPPEPGETLGEAENELGINDWLDAETGEPAEGQSPPHLSDE